MPFYSIDEALANAPLSQVAAALEDQQDLTIDTNTLRRWRANAAA